MYQKIYDFCKVKNKGMCFKNGTEPTPRVNFITDLCEKEGLDYELDVWGEVSKAAEYTIFDIPEIADHIKDEDYDEVRDLYDRFQEEARELLSSAGIDSEPEDLTPEEMDMLGDDFYDLFDEYSQKVSAIVGEIGTPANNFYNIMLMGSSDKFVVAHHDIVNPASDNANDNSCSVINALTIKKLRPEINVVILDGEEPVSL